MAEKAGRSVGKRLAGPVEALAYAIADRVTDLVVQALDVNALLSKVAPNSVLDRVDVNALLDRVDVNALLDRVDVDRLLNRADVDKMLRSADLNAVLAGIDIDALLDRVDVNQAVERIDIDSLVEHADLGTIIARSSGWVASGALDVVRGQAVGLDESIARLVARLRRRAYPGPPGPPESADFTAPVVGPHGTPPPVTQARLQGRFAGAASRLVAYLVDATVSSGLFVLALAAVSYAASIVTGHAISWGRSGLIAGIIYLAWEFAYYAYSWAACGKTLGMALLGVRVIQPDGGGLRPSQAIVRTLVFPVNFLLLGLGFIGILTQRRRQALHDLVAGTAVSYDWDARAARFRFLAHSRDARPGSGKAGAGLIASSAASAQDVVVTGGEHSPEPPVAHPVGPAGGLSMCGPRSRMRSTVKKTSSSSGWAPRGSMVMLDSAWRGGGVTDEPARRQFGAPFVSGADRAAGERSIVAGSER